MKNIVVLLILIVGCSGCVGFMQEPGGEFNVEFLRCGTMNTVYRTETGWTPTHIIKRTDRINLKFHKRFGCLLSANRMLSNQESDAELVYVFSTPLVHPEKGNIATLRRTLPFRKGHLYFIHYHIDGQWKYAPGKMTMQVWHQDKKLGEREFFLYE